MHFEPRLWSFTAGVRGRIVGTTAIGLLGVALGIVRLALLAWVIGQVFAGRPLGALMGPIILVAATMLLRGLIEHARAVMAHTTAARVQMQLRRTIFDKVMALGPSGTGGHRSGAITLSLIDGVEQLETYFGQFLPQFLIALLTPLLILGFIAFLDLPVAFVMLAFALVALFAPALWHKADSRNALELRESYAAFAAEFLDSIQGLVTLKAFGQSNARAARLEKDAHGLFQRTMRVLGTNVLARGITDSAIACGAAAALAMGAWRVDQGQMTLSALLVILMLGIEIFRPMRELRTVLHQGMVGLSAAKGIYALLDAKPPIPATNHLAHVEDIEPTIAFEGISFHYPGTERVVHDGLDFEARAGERIGLVGPSGGGKSSIVRLLLRFYDPDGGAIRLGGHDLRDLPVDRIRQMISVVNQDTFLFHGTFLDNIRLGRPDASEADVEAAARAANIHDFIAGLPHGYATQIGEKGVKLSGGQRQRVAIARALLRDTPILVLDEALSAVDAENEAVIQNALDRLMQGRTVLILAHRLSSVIACDRILVLKDGHVVESGDHAALMGKGGVYAELMAEQAREASSVAPAEFVASSAESSVERRQDTVHQAPTEGIIKAEGLSTWQLIVSLMRMVLPWKGRVVATFLLGVARVLAFIGVGVLSALVILHLKNGQPYGPLLWALAIVAPLSGILHWLESWIAHDMAFRLLAEMRLAVFRKLDLLAPGYLVRRRTGDLMTLATHDIELVEYFFAHTVAPAFVAVLVPAAVVAILAWASPWLALTLVPFLLVAALSPFLRRRRVDALGARAREAAGELGAFVVDSVQGMGELVVCQRERARGDELDLLSRHHIALRLPFFAELTWQQSLLDVITGLGGLAVVIVGALLTNAARLDAGLLPLLTLLAMAAFLPVSEIAQVGRQLADTLAATRRIYGLEQEPVVVVDGPGVASPAMHADIRVKTLTFTYAGQHVPALQHLDLRIAAGQTTAIVGMSGAGKSTLAQLLLRFFDPDQGSIEMAGHDLRVYQLDVLRRNIALVAQDTYLFNDSLRANILMARPDASEADLRAAITRASLDGLLETLPHGLDTNVGERGTALSGGQRQRVAIARAFLKDASILILDEATSHLDAANEKAIRRALDELKVNRTTIVIAHRLATIRDADTIVVLERGRLAEQGTHAELVARGGLYARLVSRQLAAGQQASAA